MAQAGDWAKLVRSLLQKKSVEITINGVNEENLENTKKEFEDKGFKVQSVLGPMEDENTRVELLKACPEPDILINNSGGPPPGKFFEWSEDDFLSAIKSNFTQSAMLMQSVLPGMKERKFGRIINILSAMVKNPHVIMGLSTSARCWFCLDFQKDYLEKWLNSTLP